MLRKLLALELSLIFVLCPAYAMQGATFEGIVNSGAVSSGGTAPTLTSSGATFGFSTPVTIAMGTVAVGDFISYLAGAAGTGQTFTPTLTGSCAASGGNSTDTGPTNQGVVTFTGQAGHFKITTGGSCTLSIAYTGGGSGTVSYQDINGSSAIDVKGTTLNPQNAPGTGANAVVSNNITTTASNELVVAQSLNTNVGGGTVSAGTSPLTWTLGGTNSTFPQGTESFTQSGAGVIQATFGYSVNPWTQTYIWGYKP